MPPNLPGRFALVVGNAQYGDPRHTHYNLVTPVKDAEDISKRIGEFGYTCHPAKDKPMINLGRNDFQNALADFSEKIELEKADVALFYYAGHGLQIGTQSLFIPTRISAPDPNDHDVVDRDLISLDLVVKRLRAGDSGHTRKLIIILDACRTTARRGATTLLDKITIAGTKRKRKTAEAFRAGSLDRVGIYIAFSTQAEQLAYDHVFGDDGAPSEHSPFAEALLRELESPNVPIDRIFANVRKEVFEITYKLDESDPRPQIPWSHSCLVEDFFIAQDNAGSEGRARKSRMDLGVEQLCKAISESTVARIEQEGGVLKGLEKQISSLTESLGANADEIKLRERLEHSDLRIKELEEELNIARVESANTLASLRGLEEVNSKLAEEREARASAEHVRRELEVKINDLMVRGVELERELAKLLEERRELEEKVKSEVGSLEAEKRDLHGRLRIAEDRAMKLRVQVDELARVNAGQKGRIERLRARIARVLDLDEENRRLWSEVRAAGEELRKAKANRARRDQGREAGLLERMDGLKKKLEENQEEFERIARELREEEADEGEKVARVGG